MVAAIAIEGCGSEWFTEATVGIGLVQITTYLCCLKQVIKTINPAKESNMTGQGPYSLASDVIGCIMWLVIGFAAAGGVVAAVWFVLGVLAGVMI